MSTSQKLPTASADGYKPGKSIMHALNYQGKRDVRVSTVDKPTITDPADIPDLRKPRSSATNVSVLLNTLMLRLPSSRLVTA